MSLAGHVTVRITPQIALAVAGWLRSTPMRLPPDWRRLGKNFERTERRRLAGLFKKLGASKRGERNISLLRSDALFLFAIKEPDLPLVNGCRVFRSQSSWPEEIQTFRAACRAAYWAGRGNPRFRKYPLAKDYAAAQKNELEDSSIRRLARQERVARYWELPESKIKLLKSLHGDHPPLQPQRKKTPE